MKTIGLLVVSFLMSAVWGSALHAAPADLNPVGYWKGAITLPTSPLEIAIEVRRGSNQALQGTIDIPAQGLRGFALSTPKADGATISFGMPGVPGDPLFSGVISADSSTISGDFSQNGQTFPFKLERSTRPTAASEPVAVPGKGLNGHWQGTLKPVPGVELRLGLEASDVDTDKPTGVLISIDQGGARIPVTSISEKAGTVHFENASIDGSYDGKLNADGSMIEGTWTQHGKSSPLALKRLAVTK